MAMGTGPAGRALSGTHGLLLAVRAPMRSGVVAPLRTIGNPLKDTWPWRRTRRCRAMRRPCAGNNPLGAYGRAAGLRHYATSSRRRPNGELSGTRPCVGMRVG